MKAKEQVEKTGQNQARSQKISERSKGGGRLDAKGVTTNSKRKTKNKSEALDRRPL